MSTAISDKKNAKTTTESPKNNPLYPVFLKLEQLHTLVVGGGNVGIEKLQSLLRNAPEAHITVVAPEIRDEITDLTNVHKHLKLIREPYKTAHLEGMDLVVMATDQPELHKTIREEAKDRNLLVNVADTPDLCDFYLSSIVQKGQLKIAISTNGQSPTAAKRIKEMLQESLPYELDDLISNLHKIRQQINGDFEEKVKRMNEITKPLVSNEDEKIARRWKKIVVRSLVAFTLMLFGHLLFTYLPFMEMAKDGYSIISQLDKSFKWMLLAGFCAQLVDGALGMGYGVTSASILLSAGISPAAISGSIHTAETFAAAASGYSHYKFGNVNMKLFKKMVIPGVLGAIAGAVLLVFFGEKYGNYVKPFIAVYTLFLGIKFIINAFRTNKNVKKLKHYSLLATVGGFFDSFAGGGWGPIVTTTLINRGRSHKYAVGTVSLTEFFVTLASAFTFFTLIGLSHWQTILGLIAGGVIAAPVAARLAGKFKKKTAFILLGALVIIWSIRILIKML